MENGTSIESRVYHEIRADLLEKVDREGLILLFGSSAPYKNAKGYYGRTLDMNFFYVTGLNTSGSIVAMWHEGGAPRVRLFIERPNPDEEKWSGVRMTAVRAAELSGITDVAYLDEFDAFLPDMLASAAIRKLFLDITDWYEEDVPAPIDSFVRRTADAHPDIAIESITPVVADMRIVKRPEEIACIRKAVTNARLGIEAMMVSVRPGMYEYQLQAVCCNLLHDRGEMIATPMVASGGNAVILHYPKSGAVVGEEDLVLIDFCPRSNYYASDISRAFPASGRFSPRQRDLYTIGLEANKRMIDSMKPGTSFREMNEAARRFLGDGMLSVGLIDSRDEVETYYYHNVSHYIGLGIHDVGNTELPIPENATLTIDTGVYVAGEGIGLRVEDTVLITSSGCENLSSSIVKEIEDIEAYMAHARS